MFPVASVKVKPHLIQFNLQQSVPSLRRLCLSSQVRPWGYARRGAATWGFGKIESDLQHTNTAASARTTWRPPSSSGCPSVRGKTWWSAFFRVPLLLRQPGEVASEVYLKRDMILWVRHCTEASWMTISRTAATAWNPQPVKLGIQQTVQGSQRHHHNITETLQGDQIRTRTGAYWDEEHSSSEVEHRTVLIQLPQRQTILFTYPQNPSCNIWTTFWETML